jgi:hypothetical protein
VTTILGIQKPDHCLLIADSRVTDDSGRTYSHNAMTKITKRGKYLIAGAGTTQPCDIIQHVWKPPTPTPALIQRPIPFYDRRSCNINETCFNNERVHT